jgi:glycosyltransferase involved in cell wall biosynthesis
VTLVGPLPPPSAGVLVHNERLVRGLEQRRWSVTTLTNGRFPSDRVGGVHLGNSHLRHFAHIALRPPRLLHVQNTRSSLTLAAVTAARVRRVPVVLTVHSTPMSLTGRRRVTRLLAWSLRLAQSVIAVNEHVADDLRPHSGGTPVVVISPYIAPYADELDPVGADTAAWLRRHGTRPLVSFSVYRTLGRAPRRRDTYGIAAMTQVAERAEEIGQEVCLAMLLSQSPTGKRERRYLESHALRIRNALGDRFRLLLGETGPAIIRRTSVFVRPTASDGDSIAVREALAFGVPVVASHVVPRPPGTILYSAGDVSDLVANIRLALGRSPSEPSDVPADTLEEVVAVYESVRRREHGVPMDTSR